MVTIGMNYTVLPNKGEVFERAFARVLEAMQGMDGHVKSSLFRDVAVNNAYLILSEWKSKESFDQFVASEAFARVTQWGKEEVLAGRPQHHVYSHSL